MPTPRILIVDDDPEIVYLIKEVLNLLHSEVLVRNDGDSALKLLHQEMEQHQSVDVVLLVAAVFPTLESLRPRLVPRIIHEDGGNNGFPGSDVFIDLLKNFCH